MFSLLLLQVVFSAIFGQQSPQRLAKIPRDTAFRLCRDLGNRTRFPDTLKPLLVPRIVDTPQHKKVREYIHDFYASLGWSTEWDSFSDKTPFGMRKFHNLIVSLDSQSSKNFVLACHYDSKIIKGKTFIGATDSAVPCGILMDMARVMTPILKKRKNKTVGLKMIFFDGEEAFVDWTNSDSLYGSRHLAKEWEKEGQLAKITVMMLLDLLGGENPNIPNRKYGAVPLFSDLVKIEEDVIGMRCSEPVKKVFALDFAWYSIEDDHKPFLERKVPVLHLISDPFPTFWHETDDNESALHYPTIDHLNAVFRIFTARYFNISSV